MHSTLDAEGGILYFQYQNGVGLAMKGISTTNASTTYDEPSLFYTFDFDPKTRLLFGIALTFDETRPIRSFGSLDVATGESKTLLNMSDYAENLAATAFDPQARTLSCMLLPQGQQSANLVTLNVDSATVVGEPNLCPRYDMCPRNLGLVGDSVIKLPPPLAPREEDGAGWGGVGANYALFGRPRPPVWADCDNSSL